MKAAEGLFYQENIFELVMFVGLGVAIAFFVVGIAWEFLYRRPKISECRLTMLVNVTPTGLCSDKEQKLKGRLSKLAMAA